MNWNSHEFIWLDWAIIGIGIAMITYFVWRAVSKQKKLAGESSRD